MSVTFFHVTDGSQAHTRFIEGCQMFNSVKIRKYFHGFPHNHVSCFHAKQVWLNGGYINNSSEKTCSAN